MTRVAIFTDEPVLERGLLSLVSDIPEIQVETPCRSVDELPAIDSQPPDMLLDFRSLQAKTFRNHQAGAAPYTVCAHSRKVSKS